MNFYIAHILDSSLDKINLYNVTDKNSSKKVLNSISDLEKINDAESLLVLLPSSEVTSYEFKKNESLSEQINIANFISDVDTNFIKFVSTSDMKLAILICSDKDSFFLNSYEVTSDDGRRTRSDSASLIFSRSLIELRTFLELFLSVTLYKLILSKLESRICAI